MTTTRAVNMAFVALGLLTWVVMNDFYAFVLRAISPLANVALIGVNFRLADLLGLVTGSAVALVLWRHASVNRWAHEIANELRQVDWPDWERTKAMTYVVLAVTFIVALLLAFYDAVWAKVTLWIYGG